VKKGVQLHLAKPAKGTRILKGIVFSYIKLHLYIIYFWKITSDTFFSSSKYPFRQRKSSLYIVWFDWLLFYNYITSVCALHYLLMEITTPLMFTSDVVMEARASSDLSFIGMWNIAFIIMWPLHNQSYCNISMKNGSNVIMKTWQDISLAYAKSSHVKVVTYLIII
jgi:hypothetical protein